MSDTQRPDSKRPSMLPLAMALTGSLAMGGTGCSLVQKTAKSPSVRPAAAGNADPESRELPASLRFSPPLAIATQDDAIVRLVSGNQTCTGTLIDEDLVLTAHHCVVERGPKGEFLKTQRAPASIEVELGGDYIAWGRLKARAIVAPPCGEQGGDGDIAVLVLERKLVGVPTMKARTSAPPRIGEPLDPVGFGRCATSQGIHRIARGGGPVRAMTAETIEMFASVCPGDSGGPVLARGSSEIVGVVSLSAMDGDENTKSASIMARVDAYRSVFAHARMIGDGLAQNELPPLSCAP